MCAATVFLLNFNHILCIDRVCVAINADCGYWSLLFMPFNIFCSNWRAWMDWLESMSVPHQIQMKAKFGSAKKKINKKRIQWVLCWRPHEVARFEMSHASENSSKYSLAIYWPPLCIRNTTTGFLFCERLLLSIWR